MGIGGEVLDGRPGVTGVLTVGVAQIIKIVVAPLVRDHRMEPSPAILHRHGLGNTILYQDAINPQRLADDYGVGDTRC